MVETARLRLRDLGLCPGTMHPGALNAITDVPGVRVGQVTKNTGVGVRTGVTVILPAAGDLYRRKLVAAVHTINGYGKATGFEQVREMGVLETPIALTNTLCVGKVWDGVVSWMLQQPGGDEIVSLNPIVGECNDSVLNDIQRREIGEMDVIDALNSASTGMIEEGAVGAGTGMVCYDLKGGVGTSSRQVGDYMLGALVVTNFGSRSQLTVLGVPIGRLLANWPESHREIEGSVMVVLATDAPLTDRQLGRMARRAGLGLGRTGSTCGNSSGDFVVAFTNALRVRSGKAGQIVRVEHLHERSMNDFFQATVEVVEEAVLNSLCAAITTRGHMGKCVPALPLRRLVDIMRQFGHPEAAIPAVYAGDDPE